MKRSKRTLHCKGLTLVELIVAMAVTGVILTAVATLAYALGNANDAGNDTSRKQAHLRFATYRITELIRNSKMIINADAFGASIWRADDNGDGKMSLDEIVQIDSGMFRDMLQICSFKSVDKSAIDPMFVNSFRTNWWQSLGHDPEITTTVLMPECINVQFRPAYDPMSSPMQINYITIMFDRLENGGRRQYQIRAGSRCGSANLLDPSGLMIVSDDD